MGTDTGGSIRLPAAYTGIVGFKPSYGLVSRWGVVAYANSLDTVGILAKTVGDAKKVFGKLVGLPGQLKSLNCTRCHSRLRLSGPYLTHREHTFKNHAANRKSEKDKWQS